MKAKKKKNRKRRKSVKKEQELLNKLQGQAVRRVRKLTIEEDRRLTLEEEQCVIREVFEQEMRRNKALRGDLASALKELLQHLEDREPMDRAIEEYILETKGAEWPRLTQDDYVAIFRKAGLENSEKALDMLPTTVYQVVRHAIVTEVHVVRKGISRRLHTFCGYFNFPSPSEQLIAKCTSRVFQLQDEFVGKRTEKDVDRDWNQVLAETVPKLLPVRGRGFVVRGKDGEVMCFGVEDIEPKIGSRPCILIWANAEDRDVLLNGQKELIIDRFSSGPSSGPMPSRKTVLAMIKAQLEVEDGEREVVSSTVH